jgi:hypothetical protein
VLTGRELDLSSVFCHSLLVPLVNQQPAIHPQAHTVVGTGVEAIATAIEVGHIGPAYREMVSGENRIRCIVIPDKIYLVIASHKNGLP